MTSLVFVIIGYTTWMCIKIAATAPGNIQTGLLAGLVLPIAVLVACYLYRPLKYIITADSLLIVRPVSSRRILLQDIAEARVIEKGEMRGTIRAFGVGGF